VKLLPCDWSDPDAEALRAAQRIDIEERYGTPDSEPGPAPTADDITAFFLLRDGDVAVACGGLRAIDAASGEIKRMFVPLEHRGRGLSRVVLTGLEDHARSLGWTRLLLETGDQQPEAIGLYSSAGYVRIPNFGHYTGSDISLCFAKDL
jgi:GNAT superfamily N-acetyltransferase